MICLRSPEELYNRKSQDSRAKKKKPFSLSLTAKVDLLCYWWQNSQCGIRTLSSDNVPESQHGAAFTGGGHTLLSVLPWAKPAEELVINRGTTSGCYCFPYWWRKNIIVQWSLWCCGGFRNVSLLCFSVCVCVWTVGECFLKSQPCQRIFAFIHLGLLSRLSVHLSRVSSHRLHTRSDSSFGIQKPPRLFKTSPYLLFPAISSIASVPLCCHGKTIECKSSNLLNVH